MSEFGEGRRIGTSRAKALIPEAFPGVVEFKSWMTKIRRTNTSLCKEAKEQQTELLLGEYDGFVREVNTFIKPREGLRHQGKPVLARIADGRTW